MDELALREVAGSEGERQTDGDADGREDGGLAHDHPDDMQGPRAERDADADLFCALRGDKGEHAIDADQGEEAWRRRRRC